MLDQFPALDQKAFARQFPFGIPRSKVREITGGAISEKTLANMDSNGQGPVGAFRIGGKVIYPADSFLRWVEARTKPIQRKPRRVPDELNG